MKPARSHRDHQGNGTIGLRIDVVDIEAFEVLQAIHVHLVAQMSGANDRIALIIVSSPMKIIKQPVGEMKMPISDTTFSMVQCDDLFWEAMTCSVICLFSVQMVRNGGGVEAGGAQGGAQGRGWGGREGLEEAAILGEDGPGWEQTCRKMKGSQVGFGLGVGVEGWQSF